MSRPDEYVGPVGHEKKLHKTHFRPAEIRLRKTKKKEKMRWVQTAPGRFKLVRTAAADEAVNEKET